MEQKKDITGFYTIQKYKAIKDENGELQCGDLISEEEHQNTIHNGFMYKSNIIGAGCGGQDYSTSYATIDGVYYSGIHYWDVWRLGFNMAISTRKYYGPEINICYDYYNSSAVNDNYDLIVGNWISGSTFPVYTAPTETSPGSCVYTRRFEPPSTITREINTIHLYNNYVTYSYRCKPVVSIVQLDSPCYQYPDEILVIKYRILFEQDVSKYSPSFYPSSAFIWMLTNERSNNINSSLSNSSWGSEWHNPYYMKAIAAPYEPLPEMTRNDLPSYKETTLNSCYNVDMVYTGTQTTALADLPGKPFGSYIYRRYSDGWAKNQKKIRRPQDTVVQSTFGKTNLSLSTAPFLDTTSIPNGVALPSITDRELESDLTNYNSKGIVECQKINIKSSGAIGTAEYNVQTRYYTAFNSSIITYKPDGIALPRILDSTSDVDGNKMQITDHTSHNNLQIEYHFPEFITYNLSGLVIYNTNPEIDPIVFDSNSSPALPVSNIKQIRQFENGDNSTIIIACGNTGLWKISRTFGSIGYNTAIVEQIIPNNVDVPDNCNGFCVFDYDANLDITKKWYALFGMQLATSIDQGSTWLVDDAFSVTNLTVELANTNIYGIVCDPTSESENLFINYPSSPHNNSYIIDNQGYYGSDPVIYSSSSVMLGQGVWYSLSTQISTIVSVPAGMNIRWGWQWAVFCYDGIWYFAAFGNQITKRLYYTNHNNTTIADYYYICSTRTGSWYDQRCPMFIPTRKFVNGIPQYIMHTNATSTSNSSYANQSWIVNVGYLDNLPLIDSATYDPTQLFKINDTTYNASGWYIGRGLFTWMSSNICYAYFGWDVVNGSDCSGTLWEPHVWDTYGWDGSNWTTDVSTYKATSETTDIMPTNLRLDWTGYNNDITDFTVDDYFYTYIFDGIFKDDSTSFTLTQYIESSISAGGDTFTPSTLPTPYANVLSGESIRVWNWNEAFKDFMPAGQCTTIGRDWERNNNSSVTMWPYLIKDDFKLTFYLSSGSGYDDSHDLLDQYSQGFGFMYKDITTTDALVASGGDFTSDTSTFCAVNIQYPRSSTLATAKVVNCKVYKAGSLVLTTTIDDYDPKIQWRMIKNIDSGTGAVTVDIIYNDIVIYTCAVSDTDTNYFVPASFTIRGSNSGYTRGVSAWGIKLYGTDYLQKVAVGDSSGTGIWDSNFCYLHMYLYTLGLRPMYLNGELCAINAMSNNFPAPGEITMTYGGYILYNASDASKVISGEWRHSIMPTV